MCRVVWPYGSINTCLQSLVTEKFGEETWEKLKASADVQDAFMTYTVYDDVITIKLIQEACEVLGVSMEAILKLFGEYFFKFCKTSGYDRMVRTLGGNLTEFIENLDVLHSYLAHSYQEMNAPSFRVERGAEGKMLLHYYSDRSGLCHIVPGIIEAVAKDFFDTDVTVDILDVNQEEERTGKKEHVVFLVVQKSHGQMRRAKPKGSQDSQDSQRGRETPEAAFLRIKEKYLSVSIYAVKESRWEVMRNIVMFGKGHLRDTFELIYPERLWIEVKTFYTAFPFHVIFDESKYVPGLQTQKIRLDEYFSIVHPQVTFNIFSICKFIKSICPEGAQGDAACSLENPCAACCTCGSPRLRSLQELEERRMHLSDIAPHDPTRDLILLNQQRLAEIELSNQLERKEEEELRTLLYAMLPEHVANQLKEGRKVAAGEFKTCTILFSDVVTFTNICAACEPIQIVNMLNSTYPKFDRLTGVHEVYKVETIGDAYMVVGGVPGPVGSHAQRVVNFALGMMISAKEVMNPLPENPSREVVYPTCRLTGSELRLRCETVSSQQARHSGAIRVGIHTGQVLAGVVGDKMPRYCLFGDTVNTASQMESHGLPSKVHLGPMTYRALENQGFEITEQGEIEAKGKGKMTTYFLIRNLKASKDEIMGKPQARLDCEEASDQGSRDGKTLAAMRCRDITVIIGGSMR
ncbi:hypothetical protein MJG53_009807 [Ovis ammon polii x Ovis aries]|uniref:Uncharacterized protein n=1 Tax=Ovis ammon polii x Ovis aries TaxID=2918886 RepID=A0ACB9UVH4_9CETA|nr:hypothetical protein MJG53_009807 [Ovis ammon polii x Ovis aries]